MNQTAHSLVGRPRGSSRAMLQEAAAELFLEQGYAATKIEQIARRAGVSRNTFFNYFPAKSDLLWVDVDAILAETPAALAAAATTAVTSPVDVVRQALLALAEGMGPGQVPWALTQADVMGTVQELQASALFRFSAQVESLGRMVEQRAGREAGDPLCRAFAAAVFAAVCTATLHWARAGVSRGPLQPCVAAAIDPVCDGFRTALPTG